VHTSPESDDKGQRGYAIIKYNFKAAEPTRVLRFITCDNRFHWYSSEIPAGTVINSYGMHAIIAGFRRGDSSELCILCFNVITESFHRLSYQYPDKIQERLYEDWPDMQVRYTLAYRDSHMTSAIIDCNEAQETSRVSIFKHINLDLFPPTLNSADQAIIIEDEEMNTYEETVLLDDDFMVIAGMCCYAVWSFGEHKFLSRETPSSSDTGWDSSDSDFSARHDVDF
jgi:hypothetical protein